MIMKKRCDTIIQDISKPDQNFAGYLSILGAALSSLQNYGVCKKIVVNIIVNNNNNNIIIGERYTKYKIYIKYGIIIMSAFVVCTLWGKFPLSPFKSNDKPKVNTQDPQYVLSPKKTQHINRI